MFTGMANEMVIFHSFYFKSTLFCYQYALIILSQSLDIVTIKFHKIETLHQNNKYGLSSLLIGIRVNTYFVTILLFDCL